MSLLSSRTNNSYQIKTSTTSSSISKPKESFISFVFRRVKQLYNMFYQNMRKLLWVGSLGTNDYYCRFYILNSSFFFWVFNVNAKRNPKKYGVRPRINVMINKAL